MTGLLIKLFVKDSKNIKDQKVRGAYLTLGSFTGVVCNILLFIVKFLAGLLSGSMSIVADAFNNFFDMTSSVVTFLGFKLSTKPADKEHPFGHGRIEYMSALLVAALIILVGVELLKSSIEKIKTPDELHITAITAIILGVSILVKLWMFLFNRKLGNTVNSKALIATAFDSLSDTVTTGAVLVSVIIELIFGFNIDAYMSLAVSLFIIYNGIKTIKETLDPLLGMPPEPEMVEEIENTINSYDDFHGIHDLIVHNYGPGRTFASFHVEVPQNLNIIKCHEEIDECEKILSEKLNAQIVIHYDPIDTDNEHIKAVKQEVLSKLKEYNDEITVHDFRMVDGEHRINVIFDAVLPSGSKLTDSEAKELFTELVKEINPKYFPVITIDRNYV